MENQNFWLILVAAVAPALVLLIYIYWCDRRNPEPVRLILKGFLFGAISTAVSFLISTPLQVLGFFTTEYASFTGSLRCAFFGAAIPEETAKLLMLWLLLRRNPHFDERIDGIVYAVTIGLGFAATENIIYLFSNLDNWVSVGITRAIFSIPGHFCFAVAMGYFYSLAYFGKRKFWPIVCMWLMPVLIHGTFDAILMVSQVTPGIQGILLIVFLIFCRRIRKRASKRINAHLHDDANERYWRAINKE